MFLEFIFSGALVLGLMFVYWLNQLIAENLGIRCNVQLLIKDTRI